MANNNFQNGPGGRLVKALSKATQSSSDATSVEMGRQPIIIRPSARIYNEIDDPYAKKVKGDDNFIVNFKPRSIAELTQDQTTGGVKPAPIISPYPGKMLPEVVVEVPASKKEPVVYDEINILNPFDWKYGVTKGLKKLNTLAGGNIERGGHERESYSDLISRLEQTPGTIQYLLKHSSKLPYVSGPLSVPANFGIGAFNLAKEYDINRLAAAAGDVVLDPVNRAPVGRLAKYGIAGTANLIRSLRPAQARRLMMLGNAAPYVDFAGDVIEGAESYSDYKDKPRYEPKEMTPQQEDFLKKLSQYNFGIVK